jgi:multidrug transporter EmrE-like cation transporter
LRWIAPAIFATRSGRATGTALIAVIGVGWLRERWPALKIAAIGLIIAGVFGLNAGA